MTVIGVVGLPGSGKTEAANVARERGIPVVTMGDVVRQACRDRGLDPAEHHGEMAQRLREEDGPAAIVERSLGPIREHLADHDTVLVDGIRSGVEVDRFREAFGDEFVLVAVEADDENRAERILDRGRDNVSESGETLAARDERELGFGMGEAIERADATIENDGTLDEFREAVGDLLSGGADDLRAARQS